MKRRIRLTEGDLHRIVKESVNRVIKESQEELLWDEIDSQLQQLGDARVSKFYSDEYQITIALNSNIRGGKREVIGIMQNFGYDYYTSGANDEYIMMTFKPIQF